MANKKSNMTREKLAGFIGGQPWTREGAIPALDASLEEIEKSGIFAATECRAEYLAWVAQYKAWINATSDFSRLAKARRRDPDDHLRYRAQEDVRYAAHCATLAIRMRRLGKRWSTHRKAMERQATETAA